MAISNPSFETAVDLSPGVVESLPDSWDKAAAAVGLAAATFGPPYEWAETFEALWGGNQAALEELDPAIDLTAADFGTSPLQTIYDSFEHLWPDNEGALDAFESGDISPAVFGTAATEFDSFGVEWPARHPVADTTRFITATLIDATPANVYARLNEIKADFNLHGADATVHKVADVTNVIAAADATTLGTAITLATELWDECWQHITDGSLTWHLADSAGSITKPDDSAFYVPTNFPECSFLANLLTGALDVHFTWADASGYGYFVEFDPTATNIFAYIIDAGFDASIGAYDDFETNWKTNQDSYPAFNPGAHLTDADFTTDGAPNDYESFETELTLQVIAAPGYGDPLDIDPTNGVRVTIGGAFSATLILQVQRPGSTTWLDWDTTTAPGDMDVDPGYALVRMQTQAYTSGAPAAKLKWRPIETL